VVEKTCGDPPCVEFCVPFSRGLYVYSVEGIVQSVVATSLWHGMLRAQF
jgi:hypothetical protein